MEASSRYSLQIKLATSPLFLGQNTHAANPSSRVTVTIVLTCDRVRPGLQGSRADCLMGTPRAFLPRPRRTRQHPRPRAQPARPAGGHDDGLPRGWTVKHNSGGQRGPPTLTPGSRGVGRSSSPPARASPCARFPQGAPRRGSPFLRNRASLSRLSRLLLPAPAGNSPMESRSSLAALATPFIRRQGHSLPGQRDHPRETSESPGELPSAYWRGKEPGRDLSRRKRDPEG